MKFYYGIIILLILVFVYITNLPSTNLDSLENLNELRLYNGYYERKKPVNNYSKYIVRNNNGRNIMY